MRLAEAQEQVIEMGKALLRTGLIARTWGNISCRVNDHQFVITPSGRDYNTLTPREIVLVNIINEKSWGYVVPSLEKGVHLDVYQLRPEVNAVIHTHQTHASALSAMDRGLPTTFEGQFGGSVRCAAYGLPGSDVLRDNIREELLNGTGNAILMSHHGTVCMGETLSDAFRCSYLLERSAEQYFMDACRRTYAQEWSPNMFIYRNLFEAENKTFPDEVFVTGGGMVQEGECIITPDTDLDVRVKTIKDRSLSHSIFEKIFALRPDIQYIKQIYTPEILTYSVLERDLYTYVDDFAQINGGIMGHAPLDVDAVVEALANNHGVLLHRCGALCCGNTLDDVEALALVTEKNAHAWLTSQFFEGKEILPIPPEECEAMRSFYLENYSKRY